MGNFAAMEQTVDTILAKSSSLLAQITAYKTRIQGCFFQNQMETGISIGIEVLQKLGIDISVHPPEVEIARFLERGREITQGVSIPDLLDLPAMEDQEALAISEIATNIVSPSYITNPPLFLVLINLLVELSICHGNTAGSAYSYGCYGVLTCNLFKDIETGVSFGRLAAALDQHSVNATLKGRGMMILSTWLEHRKTHLNNTLEILSTGYQMSLNVGGSGICRSQCSFVLPQFFLVWVSITSTPNRIGCLSIGCIRLQPSCCGKLHQADWADLCQLARFGATARCFAGKFCL